MKIRILLVLITACLAGCAGMAGLADVSHDSARTPAQAGAVNVPMQWPSTHWWERYKDPTLNQLIEQALANNPDIDLARARMEQAAALADQVGADRWPQAEAGASTTRKRYAEEYDAGPPLAGHYGSSNLLSVDIRYTFDFWGRQRAAFAAALGEVAARRAELKAARIVLSSSIAKEWFALAKLLAQRQLMEQALALRSQTLEIVQYRIQAGLDTEVEHKQAQADVTATRRDIAQLDGQVLMQRNALAALAGLPLGALSDASSKLPPRSGDVVPANVPAELVGHRADIVAARLRVEVAAQGVKEAKAEFYPNISLRAFAGYARQTLSFGLSDWLSAGSRTYGIEPAISLPIFDAGRLRAQLKGRGAQLDGAIATYNKTLLAAVHEVADQIYALEAVAPQLHEQTKTLVARQTAFDLATQQYRAGLTNYLTVLSAQNALLAARQIQLNLEAQAVVLNVDLIRALGGGFEPTADMSSYITKDNE